MNWDLTIYHISQVVPYVMCFMFYFMLAKRVDNLEKKIHNGWKTIEKTVEKLLESFHQKDDR